MAFLPFYVPPTRPGRIVILGGGYAAIAALVSISRYSPATTVTLVDPGEAHVKVTHLHETFRSGLSRFKVPFSRVTERFDCRHVQAKVDVTETELTEWQQNGGLPIGDEFVEFDGLLIATGTGGAPVERSDSVLELRDFATTEGTTLIERIPFGEDPWLTVVGAGATGVQFAFELAHYIRTKNLPFRMRLVDGEDTVLKQFAPALGSYVRTRLADAKIDFVPRTFFLGQRDGKVALQDRDSGEFRELSSSASLVFSGKSSDTRLVTTIFGQVMVGGKVLGKVFAAGDCSSYRGVGSNALTAQSAVRKGKLAARNLLRACGRMKVLEPYLHRDLGYVISLGPDDAIGWLALEGNVVAGAPALVVKDLVEAQYDLLLAGIDTYLI
jgi:NADH:ubiquinone reductase (H+-translocating)